MKELERMVKTTHPVLFASQLYAEILNNTSMSNHIINLIDDDDDYHVIPYCYFHNDFMDYEEKKNTGFNNKLQNEKYKMPIVELHNTKHLRKYVVPVYKKQITETDKKYLCGMIGVPIPNHEDPYANQDHYISYIYEISSKTLYYFDSAINKNYKNTETYKILYYTFNPKIVKVNNSTFETEGGVSESEYNYIAQNIFCHTWCLWFLFQFVVNKKTMTQIDNMTSKSKGSEYDMHNLIKIKKFVYEILLDRLQLSILYKHKYFKNAFRYIIMDNDQSYIKEIIKIK